MILAINSEHVDAIHQMCNIAFGDNYVAPDYLNQYILSSHKKGFVLIENHLLIGFILVSFHNPTEIQKEILHDKEWYTNEYYHYNTIGIIQQVVVLPEFQRKGKAEQLIKHSISFFKNTIDLFLCYAWVVKDKIPIRSALINNGFTSKKIINSYWKEDSLNKKYYCKLCGPPPCNCSAEVYLLKIKAD
ncbi:MAG: GNAT family N-acetyltransferase [Vicingus serpentipes]|nr:GNAT family N-acetyltransferase [Vicingus serpentipes]